MLTGRQIIVTSCEPEVIPELCRAPHIAFREVRAGDVAGQCADSIAADADDTPSDDTADEPERTMCETRSEIPDGDGGEDDLQRDP